MLDTLNSTDFAPHLGEVCLLLQQEAFVEVILDRVTEKPLARMQRPDVRMPFSLLFKTRPGCPWEGGVFTLRVPGMADIPGVYVSRVLCTDVEPASLFQAIFN